MLFYHNKMIFRAYILVYIQFRERKKIYPVFRLHITNISCLYIAFSINLASSCTASFHRKTKLTGLLSSSNFSFVLLIALFISKDQLLFLKTLEDPRIWEVKWQTGKKSNMTSYQLFCKDFFLLDMNHFE